MSQSMTGVVTRLKITNEVAARAAALVALAILIVIIDRGFYTGGNLLQMIEQNAPLGLVVVGVGLVIIGGNWDLSAAGTAGMTGVVYASITQHDAMLLGLVAALAVGAVCGLFNGLLVTLLPVDSFMGTFASGLLFLGLALKFQGVGEEIDVTKSSFGIIGLQSVAGVPVCAIILVAAFLVSAVVLARTRTGLHLYAVGGNRDSARLVGVRTSVIVCGTFIWSGFLAGLAGAMAASQVGVGTAVSSSALPIEAFAAVVIGGIAVAGGEGTMINAGIGFLILTSINNVASALSWSNEAQQVAEGVVVLLALAANRMSEGARAGAGGAGRPPLLRRLRRALHGGRRGRPRGGATDRPVLTPMAESRPLQKQETA